MPETSAISAEQRLRYLKGIKSDKIEEPLASKGESGSLEFIWGLGEELV